MNKEIEKLIRRRTEKVDTFLSTLGNNLPVFQSSIPVDTVRLYDNKKLRNLLVDGLFKYLKKTCDGKRFKGTRIRHTLEDIACEDFNLDELTDKGRESVYAVLTSRIAECNLLEDSAIKELITERFVNKYIPTTITSTPSIAWDIIMGCMIVDTMQDMDAKWLDIGTSIPNMADLKYEDHRIIISIEKKISDILDIADDHINYVTMLLGINLFNFCKKLDDESKTQIYGNIGDLVEFKRLATTVLLMELLSSDSIDYWLIELLVEHIDMLM